MITNYTPNPFEEIYYTFQNWYWDTEYYLYRLKVNIKRAIFGQD